MTRTGGAGAILVLLVFLVGAALSQNRFGLPATLGLAAFALLYLVLVRSPKSGYLLFLACYPFWMMGFGLTGDYRTLNVFQFFMPVVPIAVALYHFRKEGRFQYSKLDLFLVLYALWYLVVLVAQSNLDGTLMAVAARNTIWMLAWLPLRYYVRQPKDFYAVVAAIVFQLIVVSALSLQQLWTGFNYMAWTGIAPEQATYVTARFDVPRLTGFFGHPVPTALFVITTLPFAFIWRTPILRWLGRLALVLGAAMIYYMQPRAALFGLAGALIIALVQLGRTPNRRGTVLATLLAVIALVTVVSINTSWIAQIFQQGSEAAASFDRLSSWEVFWHILPDTPFFGFGFRDIEGFRAFAGVVHLDSPLALWYFLMGGPVYGLLSEAFLVVGSVYLLRALTRPSLMPLSLRLAAFVGFAAQALALHANSANYSVLLSATYLAFVQNGLLVWDRQPHAPETGNASMAKLPLRVTGRPAAAHATLHGRSRTT